MRHRARTVFLHSQPLTHHVYTQKAVVCSREEGILAEYDSPRKRIHFVHAAFYSRINYYTEHIKHFLIPFIFEVKEAYLNFLSDIYRQCYTFCHAS